MTLLCFLTKIYWIVQKVIVFFPERGEEIYSISFDIFGQLNGWRFSSPQPIVFDFGHFQGERGVKVESKGQTLGLSFFLNPSKNFQTMFLFARVLPLMRILTKLDHIWGCKDPKSSREEPFHGCWIARQNFDIFNLTTANAILMKLTRLSTFMRV